MSLKLKIKKTLLKRKVNGVVTPGYYGKVITSGTRSFDELSEYAAHNSTAHKAEIRMCSELFIDAAAAAIKQGYIVDLGPLGKLYPAVKSNWEEDPEALQLRDMDGKVNYRPSADIASAIAGAEKSWTTDAATRDNSEDDDEQGGGSDQGGDDDPDGGGALS